MKIRVQPRLQVENWSLYWKESLLTQTQCLEPIELELPEPEAAEAGSDAAPTVAALLDASAAALGWPPAASLHRLDGFTGPWERVLARGRELRPEQPLRGLVAAAAAAAGGGDRTPTVTLVRVVLKADGWKIRQPGDFLSDSDSEGGSDAQ